MDNKSFSRDLLLKGSRNTFSLIRYKEVKLTGFFPLKVYHRSSLGVRFCGVCGCRKCGASSHSCLLNVHKSNGIPSSQAKDTKPSEQSKLSTLGLRRWWNSYCKRRTDSLYGYNKIRNNIIQGQKLVIGNFLLLPVPFLQQHYQQ